jgi:hypothetical protein
MTQNSTPKFSVIPLILSSPSPLYYLAEQPEWKKLASLLVKAGTQFPNNCFFILEILGADPNVAEPEKKLLPIHAVLKNMKGPVLKYYISFLIENGTNLNAKVNF